MASFVLTADSTTAVTLEASDAGFISATGGIALTAPGTDVVTMSAAASLVCLGYLVATGSSSIEIVGGTYPSVVIGQSGYLSSIGETAIAASVADVMRLYNEGSVFAQVTGVDFTTSDGSALLVVRNHGTIHGSQAAIAGIGVESSVRVVNTGLIEGQIGLSVRVLSMTVVNSGTIAGDAGAAISFWDGYADIVNTGTLLGGVFLGAGSDRYDGASGVVTGIVRSDAGNDTLIGGDGTESMAGGADADLLRGGAGDDSLAGDGAADTVAGGWGDDVINGGTDRDLLSGNAGDDTLFGADGGDELRGNAGHDDLAGGLGRDTLTGGDGRDSFVFTEPAQSFAASPDTICDFAPGEDLIVLRGASAQVISFNGDGALTGGGTASLRVCVNAGGHAVVQIDTDGDGVAEMRIPVLNTPALTAADFLL